uniref:HAT C-terminal dimerisation domain-containing protein n=1 Tax=Brassica oleracea var. oleracea TaxID=109376 RepID=A0A0D2ZQJ4_BRAOL
SLFSLFLFAIFLFVCCNFLSIYCYDASPELAKDVLAVQVSSVASESAFSTSGRILDPYRSSLTPYMIEALICTQQWMRSSNQSQPAVANLAQMLEEVDFFESLGEGEAKEVVKKWRCSFLVLRETNGVCFWCEEKEMVFVFGLNLFNLILKL